MSDSPHLILSLFPGIGLLDMAFEEAGFCVVRGPDVLWGGDVRKFHPPAGRFDGVIGGPPCQVFSKLRYLAFHKGYQVRENLIPEFERVVAEAEPRWFLMENVPDAPDASVPGYAVTTFKLNNRWVLNATPQNRLRKFSFGHRGKSVNLFSHIQLSPMEPAAFEYVVTASNPGVKYTSDRRHLSGGTGLQRRTLAECCELQGLPPDFFDETPLTAEGKQRMLGNGVPLPMGRALAAAVRAFLVEGYGDV